MTLDLDQLRTLPLPQVRHLKEKLERAKQLRRDAAIQFFVPHERQELFYSAADYHFRYARTGNRFGKSEMGACEDISYALGYRPWYPIGHPLRTLGIPSHPTTGVIITTDWDKSKEVFTEQEGAQVGKLFKYIPKSALGQPTRNHSGAIDRIPVRHISGGWSLIFLDTVKSYKQNPTGQESGAYDWIHVDEPIPQGMWNALVRGFVDRAGHAWFTCTPISEPWIDAAFIPDLEDQTKANLGTIITESESRWMMTGTMDDNPHNTEEAKRLVLSWYTEDERDARRNGVPLAYSGLVYKEFKWEVHVRKAPPVGWADWLTPPPNHCIYIANDYHYRKNNANFFVAVPPDGPAVVYHEIWQQLSLDDEVTAIKDALGGRSYQPVIMDPLASTPNKVNDLTAMDEYRMRDLAVLPATKDPVNGIRAVKALLKARGKKDEPCIIFAHHLTRTLFEIARGFIWDEDKNQPVKKNDDMMECLYRLVLQGLRYIEPATDSDYQIIQPRSIPTNVLDFDFGQREPDLAAERRSSYSKRYAPDSSPFYEDHAIL